MKLLSSTSFVPLSVWIWLWEHSLVYYTSLKCILEASSTFLAIQYTNIQRCLKKKKRARLTDKRLCFQYLRQKTTLIYTNIHIFQIVTSIKTCVFFYTVLVNILYAATDRGDLLYVLELKVPNDRVKVNAMPSSRYKKKLSLFDSFFFFFSCVFFFDCLCLLLEECRTEDHKKRKKYKWVPSRKVQNTPVCVFSFKLRT